MASTFVPTMENASVVIGDAFAPMIVTAYEGILLTWLNEDMGMDVETLHFSWFFNLFWVYFWYDLGFVSNYDTWIDWIAWILSTVVDTLALACEMTGVCVTIPLIGDMTFLDIGAAIDIFDVVKSLVTGDAYAPLNLATEWYDYAASIANIVRWIVKLLGEVMELPEEAVMAAMYAQIGFELVELSLNEVPALLEVSTWDYTNTWGPVTNLINPITYMVYEYTDILGTFPWSYLDLFYFGYSEYTWAPLWTGLIFAPDEGMPFKLPNESGLTYELMALVGAVYVLIFDSPDYVIAIGTALHAGLEVAKRSMGDDDGTLTVVADALANFGMVPTLAWSAVWFYESLLAWKAETIGTYVPNFNAFALVVMNMGALLDFQLDNIDFSSVVNLATMAVGAGYWAYY